MLRGVRERLRLRRARRHDAHPDPSHSTSLHRVDPVSVHAPTDALLSARRRDSLSRLETDRSDLIGKKLTEKAESVVNASTSHNDDTFKQPRVFRNRSLEYGQRRDRQLLSLFAGKALRPFHRTRGAPDKSRASHDRPLEPDAHDADRNPNGMPRARNDDSFSSLPSTHASRDPFLNDDVPIDISRMEGLEDRPRVNPRRETDEPHVHVFENKATQERHSPPVSSSPTSTRKRGSLWKRKYDPHTEFQSDHERDILKAVSLSEASVKEQNVRAAESLMQIVDAQVSELDVVLADVDKSVERARIVAANLPSTRDPRFESYLHARDSSTEDADPSDVKGDPDDLFSDLQWTERVWDVEAQIVERRFEDAVTGIEKLQKDDIVTAASPRTYNKLQTLILQLVSEMSARCSQGGGEAASIYAPLLGRLGMADHARQVVLDSAEAELLSELRYITSNRQDVSPRTVNVILDKALTTFKYTYGIYMKIASTESTNSSSLVAWIAEQSDKIYSEFISPVLARMKKADPVTILAVIEAARHRHAHRNAPMQKDERSLIALLETRMTTHVRKDLDGPIRDAERQLMERARMYASAIPRNWRDGPYQSGKAVCDELNVLSRGLEGALMNLGPEADVLTANLLVRPALTYCTALLEMGTKAVGDDAELQLGDVQQGVFATFVLIGKAILRLHHKFGRIPMLQRVATVLSSPNLGEVRILQAEVFARRSTLSQQKKRNTVRHVHASDSMVRPVRV